MKCKALEEENAEANILFYKDELSKLKKSHAETERKLTLLNQVSSWSLGSEVPRTVLQKELHNLWSRIMLSGFVILIILDIFENE